MQSFTFLASLFSLITSPALVGGTSVSMQGSGDPYADRVVEFNPGDPSDKDFGDPDTVLGPPDFNEAGPNGLLRLGPRGSITVRFADDHAYDGPGNDIEIFGDPANDERWRV